MNYYSADGEVAGQYDEDDILRLKEEAVIEAAKNSLEEAISEAAKAFTKTLTGSDKFEKLAVYEPVKAVLRDFLSDAFGELCGEKDIIDHVYVGDE